VLAGDLSSVRRARLHLRVADAIEAQAGTGDDEAEILAEHLFAAVPLGVAARAADALERAAGVAIRRSAYTVAEDLLERATTLRRTGGTSFEHLSAELDAVASLFFVQRIVRGHDMAVEGAPMRRACELAERTGRVDVLARLLWAQWVGVDKACELERAAELAEELRALAASSDDPVVQGLSLHALGVGRWHAGDLGAAVEALDRLAALNRSAAPQERGHIEALTAPLRPSAWRRGHPIVPFVHMLVGDFAEPAAEMERMAAAEHTPLATAIVCMFAGFGALATGDAAAAAAYGRRGIEAIPDLSSYWGPGNQLCLGAALTVVGDLDEGLSLVDQALPRYFALRTRIFVPLVHARVAQGLARGGRMDEAAEALASAAAAADEYGERWLEPIVLSVEAELRHLQGASPADVAQLFSRARDLATEQGAHAIARHVEQAAKVVASAPLS
jgi:hypothetical protein